jgi:ADP-heptose:LPS heptosyltransferase
MEGLLCDAGRHSPAREEQFGKMLKEALRRVIGMGISPRFLIARVAVLRALRLLPKAHARSSGAVEQVFFSFPYHSVGDLILSLTLLDRIHDCWPEAQIDVVVGSSMGDLVGTVPYVRRVFKLKRSRTRQFTLAAYAEIHNATGLFRKVISGTDYDLAIAPRWDSIDSFFSAYLAYLTAAPIRCGYSGTSDGGAADVDCFYTVAATGGVGEHESLRYTRLLSRCGLESVSAINLTAPDLTTPQNPIRALQAVAEARKRQHETMVPQGFGRYVVFSPGATNPRRMWPISRFGEIGRTLNDRYGLKTIVIGGPGDIQLCDKLSSAIGESAISTAGKTNPLQMLDIIADAKLFLGNDSGPAHIAGALGVNTIVISPFPISCAEDHPNSPRRFRPVGPRVKVLQPNAPMPPCSPMCQKDAQHCILQVSSAEVMESIRTTICETEAIRA